MDRKTIAFKTGSFFVFLLFVASSCSDRPSREVFPGPTGRTTDLNQAQATQAVMGGLDPSKNSQISDSSNSILGVVRLKNGQPQPEGEFVVFISARPLSGGPPLAVSRKPFRKLPFRISLTKANQMMEGTRFEGMVELTVRLDQDGAPLTRQAGDYSASTRIQVGKQNVELFLEKK